MFLRSLVPVTERPTDMSKTDPRITLDDLRHRLDALRRDGSPQLATLADWVLTHPQEMAFHSVRGLADLARVNANTVFRLSRALGFAGFDECRQAFQGAVRQGSGLYASRAERLRGAGGGALLDMVRDAAHANTDALFSESNRARIEAAADLMLAARRIHCVGVRSCLSLAHYLAYSGRMAFANFAPRISEPGDLFDVMSDTGPEDVVIPITFSLYSAETVRAHELAVRRGARIVAITDSLASPVASGAEVVFLPPMDGPQTLPSLGAAFTLAETLVAQMVARSPDAPNSIAAFEARLLDSGAYVT